jgi:hypothetical protein
MHGSWQYGGRRTGGRGWIAGRVVDVLLVRWRMRAVESSAAAGQSEMATRMDSAAFDWDMGSPSTSEAIALPSSAYTSHSTL